MKQKFLGFLGTILIAGAAIVMAVPTPVMATPGDGNCNKPNFLGMKPWYAGLCDSNDEIRKPNGETELIRFVWTIALNVLVDLLVVVGYLALGFVIYGGFQYMTSQGDPGRAARGQKTLTSAIIGTIIAMVSSVAVNTVRVILGINGSDAWDQPEFGKVQLQEAFNWAYTVAGVIAVVFIIKGAMDYLLSKGDPGKARKGTLTITYAIIGLVITIVAALITSFVISATGDAIEEGEKDTVTIIMVEEKVG